MQPSPIRNRHKHDDNDHVSQARNSIIAARHVLLNHTRYTDDTTVCQTGPKHSDLRIRHHRFATSATSASTTTQNPKQQHQMLKRIDDLPSVKNDPDGFEARNRRSRLDLYPLKSTSECPIILRSDLERNDSDGDSETSSSTHSSSFSSSSSSASKSRRKTKKPFLKRKSLASPSYEENRRVFQESEHVYPRVLAMSNLVNEDRKLFDPLLSFSNRKPPSRIELRQDNVASKLLQEREIEIKRRKRRQDEEKKKRTREKVQQQTEKRVASASPSPTFPRSSESKPQIDNNNRNTVSQPKSPSLQSIASSNMKAKIQDAVRKIQTQQNVVNTWSGAVQVSKDRAQSEKAVLIGEEITQENIEEDEEQQQVQEPEIILSANSILKPLPQMNFSSSFFAPPKIVRAPQQQQQPKKSTQQLSVVTPTPETRSATAAATATVLPSSLVALTKENLDTNASINTLLSKQSTTAATGTSLLRQLPPPPTSSFLAIRVPIIVEEKVKSKPQQNQEPFVSIMKHHNSCPTTTTTTASAEDLEQRDFSVMNNNSKRVHFADDDADVASSSDSTSSSSSSISSNTTAGTASPTLSNSKHKSSRFATSASSSQSSSAPGAFRDVQTFQDDSERSFVPSAVLDHEGF